MLYIDKYGAHACRHGMVPTLLQLGKQIEQCVQNTAYDSRLALKITGQFSG